MSSNRSYAERDEDVLCYAAFSKCGCIAAINVDREEYRKDVAKTVAGWIREGHEVRRITVAEGRHFMEIRVPKWGACVHEQAEKAAKHGFQEGLAL